MQAKCDATFLQARDSGLEAEGLLDYRMSQLALQNVTPHLKAMQSWNQTNQCQPTIKKMET